MGWITALWLVLRATVASRAALVAEILALKHQVLVLQRSVKRPKLRPLDRLFWVYLSRLWPNWRSALKIFQPDTVTTWHEQGFKLYWRWLSKPQHGGRPPIDTEIRALIRRMALASGEVSLSDRPNTELRIALTKRRPISPHSGPFGLRSPTRLQTFRRA